MAGLAGDADLRFIYDGGDAARHVIDMRLLGESAIGLDRIVSDALIVLVHRRQPRRGERAPLLLKAKEPKAGSVDLGGSLQEAIGLLQLGLPIIQQIGADFIWEWLRAALLFHSGREGEAEASMRALLAMSQQHLDSRDQSEQRRLELADRQDARLHDERMAMFDLIKAVVQKEGSSAASVAAPVGPSVNTFRFLSSGHDAFVVDREMADRLREKAEIEWSELEPWTVTPEGFTFHTRKLSVIHPERESGYLLAEVADPVFESDANPYAVAASNKTPLNVVAKAGTVFGRLERLVIVSLGPA